MSATIAVGKLKFSVFGRGYDDVRGNSGAGAKESTPLPFNAGYAEFDPTGRYCWIMRQTSPVGLYKYDTATWELADQGSVSTNFGFITKPKNVDDGYGIAYNISTGAVCVFDLTTNEIINTGTVSGLFNGNMDCIDAGDGIYRFCPVASTRTMFSIQTFDSINMTVTKTSDKGNRAGVGFIDDDSAYIYYPSEWFYQSAYIESFNTSGGSDWGQQASDDDKSFSKVSLHGLVKDGYIYVPTDVNGVWKMGEYDGLTQVNFNSPNYVRTFGDFGADKPVLVSGTFFPKYSGGRTVAAFPVYDKGIYITDFEDVYMLDNYDSAEYLPLAVTDNMILCLKNPKPSGQSSLEVFEL